MGSVPDIVVISSDEEEEEEEEEYPDHAPDFESLIQLYIERLVYSSRKKKGMSDGVRAGGDDDDDDNDDCVILDGDPDRPVVAVKAEKVGSAECGGSDELEIVAEKGKIACRDFPHSRHSCSNLPFSTTPHMEHCSMCYCFVCDTPAPCDYWGKGLWIDDHCHATDKETEWRRLREETRCWKSLPASRPENKHDVMYPMGPPLLPRQQEMQFRVSIPQPQPYFSMRDISQPCLLPDSFCPFSVVGVDPLPSYPTLANSRARQSAAEPTTVSAQAALPTARAGRDASNACTDQVTDQRVTGPGATEETNLPEDYSGECVALAPPCEEARLYVGNLPYDVDSKYLAQHFEHAGVVEDAEIVFDRETDRSCGYGFVTMSTVEEADKAVDIFHDSKLDGRVMIVYKQAAPPSQSGSSSFRIYVCNLPRKVGDSWLEDLFSEYGQVVEAEIVWEYRRKTRRSRGYGFVTMATQEERDRAITALDGQIFEERALTVKVAKEQETQHGYEHHRTPDCGLRPS